MDESVIQKILFWVGPLGTAAFFIIKWILRDRSDQTKYERSLIVPTSEWLRREADFNRRIEEQDEKIDSLRAVYEARLEKKNEEMVKQAGEFKAEIEKRDQEIRELTRQLNELTQTVKVIEKGTV